MSERGLTAVDLFAGAGGWDCGARDLGFDPLGIELDPSACATRRAAGMATVEGDIAALDPSDYPCDLLIASPPCQAWSMAGKREGEKDIARVHKLTAAIAAGRDFEEPEWADPRSRLVTEPLRWIVALKPSLVALEQVPPVLDYWNLVAGYMRDMGYSVWTGILSSERYGVPQTRKRAILMADLNGPVHPPQPTHQAYVPGEPAQHQHTLEGELLPWVSMAQALGWTDPGDAAMRSNFPGGKGGNVPRPAPAPAITGLAGSMNWEGVDVPAPTVTAGGGDNGGPEPFGRGGASQNLPSYRRTRGEGMTERYGDRPRVPAEEPAPALTAKARSDEWEYDTRQTDAQPRGGGNLRPPSSRKDSPKDAT